MLKYSRFHEKVAYFTRQQASRLVTVTHLDRQDPNHITLLGLFLALITSLLIALGYFIPAVIFLLLQGGCDLLDGAVARRQGTPRPFGQFLDSAIDRYSDGLILLGLLCFLLLHHSSFVFIILLFLSLFGSLLPSYLKSIAITQGYHLASGWASRPERIILLSLGLFFNQLFVILLLLAVLTNLTALQRFWSVFQQR